LHLQILSSGSGGNSALLRAGAHTLLVDAGLGPRSMSERLEAAGSSVRALGHIAVTHGHLDHSNSAGALSKKSGAIVHCVEALMNQPAVARAQRFATLPVGGTREIGPGLELTSVALPHDAHPTLAFRIDHATENGARRAVVLTDMGRPDRDVARALRGAHLLVLEFNHDRALLDAGPYTAALKARVRGDQGHLSNEQAAEMLAWLAGPELHTLVLAHLSETNNRPELAATAACATLERLGLGHVRVVIAEQHSVGANLEV
jgi:phosphoribosyl 1,2-cyclic phosphodiesterase